VNPNVAVHASQITLSDLYPPAFNAPPSVALVDGASALAGRLSASFAVEDRGGGIATVAVVVDDLPRSGSSRRFTIGYKAFHLDDAPSAATTVGMSVRAGLTLTVSPRLVSVRIR
jgi:hypothetical protein